MRQNIEFAAGMVFVLAYVALFVRLFVLAYKQKWHM